MKMFVVLLSFYWTLPVFANCSLNTPVVNIGIYNPLSTIALQSSSTIAVLCESVQNVSVKLSAGSSNSLYQRTLISAKNDNLNYNIFLDATRSNIFGNGAGTAFYSGPSGNIPIFVYVPPRQNIPSGYYSDNLLIELIF